MPSRKGGGGIVSEKDPLALPAMPDKRSHRMLWMVHRAWLDDPMMLELNFTNRKMPTAAQEPMIAPRLVKASSAGCSQYRRFVATCGPCMNFTTFRTSRKSSQRRSENHFKDDLAFSKKHFRFTHRICGKRNDLASSKKDFPFTKKMWEIAFELAHICCSVLILVPPF